jgi:hypothetical protein
MAEQQVTINVDYLRTTRVHICMPCYGGMLTESTFMSYIKWSNVCRQLGLEWTMETMTNESLISRARNTLVAKFLTNPDSTHLMFIDADIGWEPWHLLVLLNRDVDVIGGLYPMKSLPIKWVVNGFEGADTGPDGLQEVSKTGTGFMLVKRHVFEKLNAHPAVKPFNNDIGLSKDLDKHLKTYYDTAVRENRYYSEDWTFCENWRDLGGKVWVDKRVLLKHTGSYVFDFAAQDPLYKALHEMAQKNIPAPTAGSAAAPQAPLEPTSLITNRTAGKKPVAKKTPAKSTAPVKKAAAITANKSKTPVAAPAKTPTKQTALAKGTANKKS